MSLADRITLTGLRVRGHHGVLTHERRDGQDFVIDLVLHVDTAEAASTDNVAATAHYGEVADAVVAVVSGEPVDLIETLAARIADTVLRFARVDAVEVTVHKPQAPIAHDFLDVSVTITRGRR